MADKVTGWQDTVLMEIQIDKDSISMEIDSSFERLLCHPMNLPRILEIAIQSMSSAIEKMIKPQLEAQALTTWEARQVEIDVLKANDIRQYIPDGKYCDKCRFTNRGYCEYAKDFLRWETIASLDPLKCEGCPKPDKGEVK
jgi:hypothetical protein